MKEQDQQDPAELAADLATLARQHGVSLTEAELAAAAKTHAGVRAGLERMRVALDETEEPVQTFRPLPAQKQAPRT